MTANTTAHTNTDALSELAAQACSNSATVNLTLSPNRREQFEVMLSRGWAKCVTEFEGIGAVVIGVNPVEEPSRFVMDFRHIRIIAQRPNNQLFYTKNHGFSGALWDDCEPAARQYHVAQPTFIPQRWPITLADAFSRVQMAGYRSDWAQVCIGILHGRLVYSFTESSSAQRATWSVQVNVYTGDTERVDRAGLLATMVL